MTRIVRFLPVACAASLLFVSCGALLPSRQQLGTAARYLGTMPKVTGEVQIQWMGAKGRDVAPGEEKLAYSDIEGFDVGVGAADRGRFRYLVYNADGTLHREIIAEVTEDPRTGVAIDLDSAEARFVGIVTYDSKEAAGESGSGDGGTLAGATHEEGDCTGEAEEGGCTGDEGGCTGEEGGCTGDEGGCSGDESGCTGDEGGCSGGDGPAHPPGSDTRVTEVVAAIFHDGGTPGADGDTITWSWFYPFDEWERHDGAVPTPVIDASDTWPVELCDKPILGGNIVIHPPLAK